MRAPLRMTWRRRLYHDDLIFAVGLEPDSTPPSLYEGQTLVATSTQPPFALSWASRTGPNGAYTLTARAYAYDPAGNVTTSAAVTVRVN
jgi:hypothetical protein